MKVFITGGEGFIGSYLVDRLVKSDHQVATYDAKLNFTDNNKYYKRCLALRKKFLKTAQKSFTGDIRQIRKLSNAIKLFRPEVVVHLAALPMARVSEKHAVKLTPINMQGTLNVFEVFKNSNAKRIVYTSSSMAYGHFKQVPQSEDVVLEPENVYGATKAAGEYFVKLIDKEWVIVRPTSVYGFTDCGNRVTQLLLDAAHSGKNAWVAKGETLDFSYISDVIQGFEKCITKSKAAYHTLNISSGEGRAVSEFAKLITAHIPDFEYEVRTVPYSVYRSPMSISKAQKLLGFKPKYDIERGIEKTLELINNYNFYEF